MCHHVWAHIKNSTYHQFCRINFEPICVLHCKKKKNTQKKPLYISSGLHHISHWNKTAKFLICLLVPQNCKLWAEQNSYFCIADGGVHCSRARRKRENIFIANSFGVCTSPDSVLTSLWFHFLLKFVHGKCSYSNKHVSKAVTHVKSLSNKHSKIFWTT